MLVVSRSSAMNSQSQWSLKATSTQSYNFYSTCLTTHLQPAKKIKEYQFSNVDFFCITMLFSSCFDSFYN